MCSFSLVMMHTAEWNLQSSAHATRLLSHKPSIQSPWSYCPCSLELVDLNKKYTSKYKDNTFLRHLNWRDERISSYSSWVWGRLYRLFAYHLQVNKSGYRPSQNTSAMFTLQLGESFREIADNLRESAKLFWKTVVFSFDFNFIPFGIGKTWHLWW